MRRLMSRSSARVTTSIRLSTRSRRTARCDIQRAMLMLHTARCRCCALSARRWHAADCAMMRHAARERCLWRAVSDAARYGGCDKMMLRYEGREREKVLRVQVRYSDACVRAAARLCRRCLPFARRRRRHYSRRRLLPMPFTFFISPSCCLSTLY